MKKKPKSYRTRLGPFTRRFGQRPRAQSHLLLPIVALSLSVAGCGLEASGNAEHVVSDRFEADGSVPEATPKLRSAQGNYWPSQVIPVCFGYTSHDANGNPTIYGHSPTSQATKDFKQQIREIVESEYENIPGSHVDFVRWTDCPNDALGTFTNGIRVVLEDRDLVWSQRHCVPNQTPCGGGAGYIPGQETTIYARSDHSENAINVYALHEFAHAIGFDHEADISGSAGNYDCSTQETGGYLTAFDPDSITLGTYCHWNAELSDLDMEGISSVYPRGDMPLVGDIDGDGALEIAIYRPIGKWWAKRPRSSQNMISSVEWGGVIGDVPMLANVDNSGGDELIIYRPGNRTWWALRPISETAVVTNMQYGATGDIPMVGDIDGDGRAEAIQYRPSNGQWYAKEMTTGQVVLNGEAYGGWEVDIPLVGDFDGNGRDDIAIYRNGRWYVRDVSSGQTIVDRNYGNSTDRPLVADYDGDGADDLGLYRTWPHPRWYAITSNGDALFSSVAYGTWGDTPLPGNLDGNGGAEIALWRPTTGAWWARHPLSGNTYVSDVEYGIAR